MSMYHQPQTALSSSLVAVLCPSSSDENRDNRRDATTDSQLSPEDGDDASDHDHQRPRRWRWGGRRSKCMTLSSLCMFALMSTMKLLTIEVAGAAAIDSSTGADPSMLLNSPSSSSSYLRASRHDTITYNVNNKIVIYEKNNVKEQPVMVSHLQRMSATVASRKLEAVILGATVDTVEEEDEDDPEAEDGDNASGVEERTKDEEEVLVSEIVDKSNVDAEEYTEAVVVDEADYVDHEVKVDGKDTDDVSDEYNKKQSPPSDHEGDSKGEKATTSLPVDHDKDPTVEGIAETASSLKSKATGPEAVEAFNEEENRFDQQNLQEGEEKEEVAQENEGEKTEDLIEMEKGEEGKEEVISEEAATARPVVTPTPPPAPKRTPAPTAGPTEKPYVPTDDDPIREEEKDVAIAKEEELQEELQQEEKVARRAGGAGIFLGIVAMIFTAHQMSENPDGIYASVCRLAITISSVVVKIVCMPCRKLLGFGAGNPHYGHISSSDTYSYRGNTGGFELQQAQFG